MQKKVSKSNSTVALDDDIAQALYCDFGSNINLRMAADFDLTAGQLMEMSKLIHDLYNKSALVANLESDMAKRLKLAPDKAKNLAKEICSRRLLIVDKWLDGEPAKKLKQLGGNPDDFSAFVDEYVEALAREEIDEEESAAAQKALENPEPLREFAEEKIEEMPEFLKDPEAEKAAGLEVFGANIKDILESTDFRLRIELNVRLATLLIDDADTRFFQKELLEELYNNKEIVTKEKIELNGEQVEPTIGNWLKDYVRFVGVEDAVSSIKKAQYLAGSKNIKALSSAERVLIDKLFNLYGGVKNFYFNSERMDLADITIFPFTDEEQAAFLTEMEAEREKTEAVTKEPADLAALYRGKDEDRRLIDAEKSRIQELTRGEYDKVADELEMLLLQRRKFAIIAGLEILAETGALDNVLANDPRYQTYVVSYYKRNNLPAESTAFKANPHDARHVQSFLKFVFLERLGIAEAEGARLAANLSNIFLNNGQIEYGQLAYFDLEDDSFKWS